MGFDPEEIERMSPQIAVELQERFVRIDGKRRDFLASGQPERRENRSLPAETVHPRVERKPPRGNGWPRVWNVNDPDQAYLRQVRKLA
jgi:hypothetical protein